METSACTRRTSGVCLTSRRNIGRTLICEAIEGIARNQPGRPLRPHKSISGSKEWSMKGPLKPSSPSWNRNKSVGNPGMSKQQASAVAWLGSLSSNLLKLMSSECRLRTLLLMTCYGDDATSSKYSPLLYIYLYTYIYLPFKGAILYPL